MMLTSDMLANKNLISGPKVKEAFDTYFSDILRLNYHTPSEFIRTL